MIRILQNNIRAYEIENSWNKFDLLLKLEEEHYNKSEFQSKNERINLLK